MQEHSRPDVSSFCKSSWFPYFMNDMSLRPLPAPEMTSVEALHPKERRSRRFAWIGMAASVILFAASLVVLWHVVSGIDVEELKTAFTAASLRQIGLAILLTAVSYSLLDLLRRHRAAADQGPYPLSHHRAGLLHELRGQFHARVSPSDGGDGPLLDLRSRVA